MFSKLIINKYQDGKDTQTTEIIFKEHFINRRSCQETVYGTWRMGEVLQPVKEQRLVVNVLADYTSVIDFKTIVYYNNDKHLETLNQHTADENERSDKTEIENRNDLSGTSADLIREPKNKRRIDEISEFLIRRANGEVQTNIDMMDKNLGKICKNNEVILQNIINLNEKLYCLKKKELEESMVARLTNISHICEKCGNGFSKLATFQYHMKMHRLHGETACKVRKYRQVGRTPHSKFKPVWVCPFCHQAWPTKSDLEIHLTSSLECNLYLGTESTLSLNMTLNKAIKKCISKLLHCEFCEKLFTNITKVLKHEKQHWTDKNYHCSPCNFTSNNYNDIVQHWDSECKWKRQKYVFVHPKYLICNVCYEQFQSWDNLYLHRYEYEHFTIKCRVMHNQGESDAETLIECTRTKRKKDDILEYEFVVQCEGCGEVYMKEESLLRHREELHLQKLCQICGHISPCKVKFLKHMESHSQLTE